MLGLLLAMAAAVAETAGGSLVLARRFNVGKSLRIGQAIGAGFILALSLVGLVPEAQEHGGMTWFTVLGFLVILLVDVALGHHGESHGHVHAHGHEHAHAQGHEHANEDVRAHAHAPADARDPSVAVAGAGPGLAAAATASLKSAAVASWAGVCVCAFSDGISLASAGAAGAALGLIVFLGYMPHKFVEGFSISSVLSVSGVRRQRAAAGAALLGLSTVAGATLTLLALSNWIRLGNALAFSAGIMLNLAAGELIPHLREDGDRRLLFLVPLGTALYLLTTSLVRMAGLEP